MTLVLHTITKWLKGCLDAIPSRLFGKDIGRVCTNTCKICHSCWVPNSVIVRPERSWTFWNQAIFVAGAWFSQMSPLWSPKVPGFLGKPSWFCNPRRCLSCQGTSPPASEIPWGPGEAGHHRRGRRRSSKCPAAKMAARFTWWSHAWAITQVSNYGYHDELMTKSFSQDFTSN